jgi:hypothetical protein
MVSGGEFNCTALFTKDQGQGQGQGQGHRLEKWKTGRLGASVPPGDGVPPVGVLVMGRGICL